MDLYIFKHKSVLLIVVSAILLLLLLSVHILSPSREIEVVFDAKSKKAIEYRVLYTEAEGEQFTKEKSVTKMVPAGNCTVSIVLPVDAISRFRLDFGREPLEKLEISSLALRGVDEIKIQDYNKFHLVDIEKNKILDNLFILNSSGKDPHIIYRDNLKLQGKESKLPVRLILALFVLLSYVLYERLVASDDNSNGKTRNTSLDLVCGILILHMIWGHLASHTRTVPMGIIQIFRHMLFFFMFWFFFKAGMFFRVGQSLKNQIKKDAKRLLVPFFFFTLTPFAINSLILLSEDKLTYLYVINTLSEYAEKGVLWVNAPCWFLLSLFIVKIIYNKLHGRAHDCIVAFTSATFAYLLYKFHVVIPVMLGNIALGLACYAIGKYTTQQRQHERYIVLAAWAIFFFIFYIQLSFFDVRTNGLKNECHYLLTFIHAIAGCILINKVAEMLPKWMYNFRLTAIIRHIGKRSMVYYVCHWPLIKMLNHYIAYDCLRYEISSQNYLFIQIALLVVMLPLLDYLFHSNRWLTRLLGE